jgi:hypothetical protein
MHHGVNRVSFNGLTCAVLNTHQFALVEDAREEMCAFWRVCLDRVRRLLSSMPCYFKSATAAERYSASVSATILEPRRGLPSPTH